MQISLPYEPTPVETIPQIVQKVKDSYNSQKTKSIEYRLYQLRKLYWGLNDYTKEIIAACHQDLRKPVFETYMSEIDWCKNDIIFVTRNLRKWAKDEYAPDIPLNFSAVRPKIRKDPLGTVLVIGAFNFPIQLSIGPVIGAIAAGCTCILKPSELSETTAMVIKTIFERYLDPTSYVVINGAIPETTALLDQKWDKIFYTGSSAVGTIIAKKAAETLTPVCLELGGRNPAIITKNANPRLAARRLLWGKALNAGQVCISQNYVLVEKEALPNFVENLTYFLNEFYPHGQKSSPDYGRIVNNRHFWRIRKLLESTNGRILIGGQCDEAENFIETTVVEVQNIDDPLIREESFGPIIPILAFSGLDQAIHMANAVHSTPLGLYIFGNKAETEKVLNEISAGGTSVNDAYFHGSIPTLAFGGRGDSGQGSYRGKASFDAFTHFRSITTTPNWVERFISLRYPPYHGNISKLRLLTSLRPNFNRDCKEIKGLKYWLGILFSLGSDSCKTALLKWFTLAIIGLLAKRILY